MKKFILIAMLGLFCTASFASTAPIEPTKTDDFIGKTIMGSVSEGLFLLTVELRNIKTEIFVSCELDAVPYCITEDSKVVFTLSTGKTVTLTNINGFDCNRSAKIIMFISAENRKLLKEYKVVRISMQTQDGTIAIKNIIDQGFFTRLLPS